MSGDPSETAQMPTHHIKQAYCESRENYRKGKRLTAVKVYTVNDESTYLIISRIQAIKLSEELLRLLSSHGVVKEFRKLDDYPTEAFEEAYLVQYSHISRAKKAKRRLDEKDFFGSMLHVFYAPEYETREEVVKKLQDRSRSVVNRIKYLNREANKMEEKKQKEADKTWRQQRQSEEKQQQLSSTSVGAQGKWQGNYQADIVLPNNPDKTQVAGSSSSSSRKRKQNNNQPKPKRPRFETSIFPKSPHPNTVPLSHKGEPGLVKVCSFVPRNVNLKNLKKNKNN